jgi:hypothetical protein
MILVTGASGNAGGAVLKKVRRFAGAGNIGDFSNWRDQAAYEAAFQRLLRDLKARQSNPEGA